MNTLGAKQVIKMLLVLTTFILISITIFVLKQDLKNKVNNTGYQNSTNLTVDEVVELIKDDYIIINENGFIRYRGYTSDVLNSEYQDKEVKEIAYCDDREYTICIFIK